MAGAGNPAQTGNNVFQQSSGALTSGINAAQGTAQFQGQQVGTDFGYTPDDVMQQTASNIGTFMNPYTQQVIDTSMADLERQRQMQMNQIGAQATQAGAFGGSREGVAQALTNEAFARQGGQLASGLRQQGFETALSTAGQGALANQQARARAEEFGQGTTLDAQRANQQAAQQAANLRLQSAGQLGSLSQTGFGQGMDIARQQQQQGLAQQAMNQQLIDRARGQFAGFTGAPTTSLGLPMAAVGAADMGQQTQTSSMQPGLFDYLSLGASVAAAPMTGGGSIAGNFFGGASDPRLKINVKPLEKRGGIQFYSWDWNDEGKRIAHPDQPTVGVMADELQETHPHLVQRGADGYLRVDYGGLAGAIG